MGEGEVKSRSRKERRFLTYLGNSIELTSDDHDTLRVTGNSFSNSDLGATLVPDLVDVLSLLSNDDTGILSDDKRSHLDCSGGGGSGSSVCVGSFGVCR